jgi:hypothetical protein
MRRQNAPSPLDRGASIIEAEGVSAQDYEDDDMRQWTGRMPREPIR